MQSDTYASSDFQRIIFLMANDCQLIDSERIGDKKVSFVFANRGKCEGLVEAMFYNDKVSLSRVLHEIRKARNIIHETN